jgi:hypothetical protein
MRPPEIESRPEYLAARRVLLDALEALGPHEAAVVLAGAQAVYLRAGPRSLPIADFTTDGDLAIDPRRLSEVPPLGELMEAAGFELTELQGSPEPGIWQKEVAVDGLSFTVPVDLIVPSEVAPPGGTRGARLPGHGRRAARKTTGLEATLVDNDVMSVAALEPEDRRSARLRVAGVAALLVAKTHKIADRIDLGRTDRLEDKDASDVLRLMGAGAPAVVAATLRTLLEDPVAEESTRFAIGRLRGLFGNRASVGIEMAAEALRGAMPEERVRAICLAFTAELYRELGADGSSAEGAATGRAGRPPRPEDRD